MRKSKLALKLRLKGLTYREYCPRCKMEKRRFKRCKICGRRCSPDELVKDEHGEPTKLCKECAVKLTLLAQGGD